MTDISIVVPIYNSEKYIKKCIDSLINQTYKNIEIILVNDGSNDNTEKIIKDYKDKRIKYFKNKNHGIGYSRNFGIKKATSKYIMFVDSDDYLELDACSKVMENIKDNDILVFNFNKIINKSIEKIKINEFKASSLKENPNLLLDINLSPWNKVYKRDMLIKNNIKFEEQLKYEDATFVSYSLDRASKITYMDEYLYNYVIHSKSETTIRDEKVFDIIKVVDKIRVYFENKDYMNETINKLIVRILTNYTIQQRVNVNSKSGYKFIDDAFDYLNKFVPDYKNNKYYEGRGILRRTIEKNKTLTKLYVKTYRCLKNRS